MKKMLSLGVLALVAMAIPAIVKAAENTRKADEVIVTTTLEPAH